MALDNENWQKLEADQIEYSLCTVCVEIYNSNVSMLLLVTNGCRIIFRCHFQTPGKNKPEPQVRFFFLFYRVRGGLNLGETVQKAMFQTSPRIKLS